MGETDIFYGQIYEQNVWIVNTSTKLILYKIKFSCKKWYKETKHMCMFLVFPVYLYYT